MSKLHFSVLLSLVLCTGCATQTKLPYPTGAVRKLNLDKRPIESKAPTQPVLPSSTPRNSGEYGNGLGH